MFLNAWTIISAHVASASTTHFAALKHHYRLLDGDANGVVTLAEAANGYSTLGATPNEWRRQLSRDWSAMARFSCSLSLLRADDDLDPADFVDCIAFHSRVRLLRNAAASPSAPLPFERAFNTWINNGDGAIDSSSMESALLLPVPAAVPLRMTNITTTAAATSSATILISSDWHIEPWYAGDALASPQAWFNDGTTRFLDAGLTNMMRCADGATGTHALPCNLTGKSDPPIEHIITHFDAFSRLRRTLNDDASHDDDSLLGSPAPDSFFFAGDTQAHKMNWTAGGKPEYGNFSRDYRFPPAISALMAAVFKVVVPRFGAEHIFWGAGNHDGPEDETFKSATDEGIVAASLAWGNALVTNGIVTNDLGRQYNSSSAVQFFLQTGYYMKRFAALPDANLFVICTNTNLGLSNTRQNIAFYDDLAWIAKRGGAVYLIGHHPQTIGCLVEQGKAHSCGYDKWIPAQYRPIIRGVFAGHIHKHHATNTTNYFTQLGSIDQAGDDTFYIADITNEAGEDYRIVVDASHGDLVTYRSGPGLPNETLWHISHDAPTAPPTPSPQPTPTPPGPPAPRGWECHVALEATFKSSVVVNDTDWHDGFTDLASCTAKCLHVELCEAVNWHASDRHCHTLAGAYTHEQYEASLRNASNYDKDEVTTCMYWNGPTPPPSSPPPHRPYDGPIDGVVLAVGDWGGETRSPFAGEEQVTVAAGMGRYAAAKNALNMTVTDVLGLGDNFYSCGINCSRTSCDGSAEVDNFNGTCVADETNHRFLDVFENVYTAPSLDIPFRIIAGNHDHHGNVTAQLAYTRTSSRWHYPDWFYLWSRTFGENNNTVSVDFVMIDTVMLTNAFEVNDTRVGPSNDTQWAFINDTLARSKADYLWVGGHFPVYSGCEHGSNPELVAKLRPLLEQHGATGYISGHDHCSSHVDERRGPVYALTGNGDNCCYASKKAETIPQGATKFAYWDGPCPAGAICADASAKKTAFAALLFGPDAMAVEYVDSEGKVLYRTRALAKRETE